MAATEALSAVRAAKQELRKTLRKALAAMTDQQRKEESEKLVKKVPDNLETLFMAVLLHA